MNKNVVRMLALVGSLGFAACDATDVALEELTEVEAQEMAEVVMFATFVSVEDVPESPSGVEGPAAAPFTYASEYEGVVQCPLGGSVAVAASFEANGDTESEAGSAEFSMTQVHDGCVGVSEADRMFTLWGDPDMNAAFTVENDGRGMIEWAGSMEGGLEWESEGRRGRCSINMQFSGSDQQGAVAAAQLSGTVCGHTISRSMSIDRGNSGT